MLNLWTVKRQELYFMVLKDELYPWCLLSTLFPKFLSYRFSKNHLHQHHLNRSNRFIRHRFTSGPAQKRLMRDL